TVHLVLCMGRSYRRRVLSRRASPLVVGAKSPVATAQGEQHSRCAGVIFYPTFRDPLCKSDIERRNGTALVIRIPSVCVQCNRFRHSFHPTSTVGKVGPPALAQWSKWSMVVRMGTLFGYPTRASGSDWHFYLVQSATGRFTADARDCVLHPFAGTVALSLASSDAS